MDLKNKLRLIVYLWFSRNSCSFRYCSCRSLLFIY